MGIAEQPNLTLDQESIEELTSQYISVVSQLAKRANLNAADVLISEKALSLALSESSTDLDIMKLRRKPPKGIGLSKIAGIVAFRLARFAPINLASNALDNDLAQKLNELAALALAFRCILQINISSIPSTNATQELQYAMVRRHMNQETLGLTFEILATSI